MYGLLMDLVLDTSTKVISVEAIHSFAGKEKVLITAPFITGLAPAGFQLTQRSFPV